MLCLTAATCWPGLVGLGSEQQLIAWRRWKLVKMSVPARHLTLMLLAGQVAAGRYKASRDSAVPADSRVFPRGTARISADIAADRVIPQQTANARTDRSFSAR
jgi:hypothetical protein